MEGSYYISGVWLCTSNHFTLQSFLHSDLNSYKKLQDLNKAMSQCDPAARCVVMMRKNVPGQPGTMRPTQIVKRISAFYVRAVYLRKM